jgi:hypothetical protein
VAGSSGNTTVSGTLGVAGTVTFNSLITSTSTTNKTLIHGNANTGQLNATELSTTGYLKYDSTAATFSIDTLSGKADLSGATFTGAVTANNNLSVSGTTNLNNTTNITGNTTIGTSGTNKNLTVNGNSSTTGDSSVGGNLSVSGNFSRACTSVDLSSDNILLGGATVETGSCFILQGSSVTFTLANGSSAGQLLTLIAATGSTLTLSDGAADPTATSPLLAGDAAWNPGPFDTIELIWTGTVWAELHRSNN